MNIQKIKTKEYTKNKEKSLTKIKPFDIANTNW